MDAKRFGAFLVTLRKEKGMTQKQLAEMLYVTDKAVSRWERGIGFPDISTIEPLADTLGVSVLELMRCERMEGNTVEQETAVSALDEFSQLAERQRQTEHKRSATIYSIVLCILSAILLAVRECVPDSDGLLIWLLLIGLGIPGLVRDRRTYESRKGRKAWNRMLLRSIALAVAIMACLIIVTVWYAVHRS